MITNTTLKHPKHRKYRVLSFGHTYCMVEDIKTGENYSCFPLQHKTGDELYLFENHFDILTGKKSFAYSVLNLYKAGESYAFDVEEDREKIFLVSNYEGLRLAAPISCRSVNYPKRETLQVEALDLDKNRLLFRQPENAAPIIDYTALDFTVFEEGQVYTLPITGGFTNKKGNRYILAKHEGKEYPVNIPKKLAGLEFGTEAQFQLGKYAQSDRPTLRLMRHSIISRIYEPGKQYSFCIAEIIFDENNQTVIWNLADAYGYTNHYSPDTDMSNHGEIAYNKNIGDELLLYIRKISDLGFLTLVAALTEVETHQHSVEEVFQEIGFAGKEQDYFYHLTDEQPTEEQEKRGKNFLTQYKDGENLWVLSYVSFLEKQLRKELRDGEYMQARTLLQIYLEIEKWIIYRSPFLRNFRPDKRGEIIRFAEDKIKQLEARLTAVELYVEDKDQEFTARAMQQLQTTTYLPESQKNILIELVRVSEFFTEESGDQQFYNAIVLLLKHQLLAEEDKVFLSAVLRKKAGAEWRRIETAAENNHSENEAEVQKNLVKYQYLLLLLTYQKEGQHNNVSINLLRYLSAYYGDKNYLDLAIELIVKNGWLKPHISRQDVFALDIKDFEQMAEYPPMVNSYSQVSGQIIKKDGGLILLPKNHFRKNQNTLGNEVALLPGHYIAVHSYMDTVRITAEQEMGEMLDNIFRFLEFVRPSVDEAELPDIGKVYTGIVKKDIKENYCFLEAQGDSQFFDTLLHVTSFNKSGFFGGMNEYLYEGDQVNFEITGYSDGKPQISVDHYLRDYAEEMLEEDIQAIGKVVNIYGNRTFIITEQGWPLIIFNSPYSVGDYVMLEISGYDEKFHVFKSSEDHITDGSFPGDPARLYRNFLIAIGMLEAASVGNQLHLVKGNENNMLFLIHCLNEYRKFVSDEKTGVLYIFFITVISSLINNPKSYEFTEKLKNLRTIYLAGKNETETAFEKVTDVSEGTEKDQPAFQMLQYFGKDVVSLPLNIGENSKFYKLKKLIEANNVVKQYDDSVQIGKYFKNLVIKELYNISIEQDINAFSEIDFFTLDYEEEKKSNEPLNLGMESRSREFKTSFFHSASDIPQEQIILRTICGFLNGYEDAVLYIGVNDSGEVSGLKDEFTFHKDIRTKDQYQNHIQSRIAAAFPKEINGLIEYSFKEDNGKDFLEIRIPKYDKPVSYNGEFYQRQGVQTRILKGSDITDFMYRKMTGDHSRPAYEAQIRESSSGSSAVVESASELLSFDFYNDQRKDGLQSTVAAQTNQDLLGYLYIYSNGEYMLSKQELSNYMFKVEITENHRFSHLLMCYDNACVNKIEIRTLLSKTFNKRYMNGLSEDGKLMKVVVANKKSEIIIVVNRNGKEYIKIFPEDRVTTHRGMGLKGNCILQEDFDQVKHYWVQSDLPEEFNPFRRESKQGLGAEASKYEKMYEFLIKCLVDV